MVKCIAVLGLLPLLVAPILSEAEIYGQPPSGTILNPMCVVDGAALAVAQVESLLDDLVNLVRSVLRALPGLLDLVAVPLSVVARDTLVMTKDVLACLGDQRDSHEKPGVAKCILDALREGFLKIRQQLPPLHFALGQLLIGAVAAPLLDLAIALGNALYGILDLVSFVVHCLATRNFLTTGPD